MTEIWNLSAICRCCHSDGHFKSLQLSYSYNGQIEVYYTMLRTTLGISIDPPCIEASNMICDPCITKLRDAAAFRSQVMECELKFHQYCQNELIMQQEIKEEIDDEDDSYEEDKYEMPVEYDGDLHAMKGCKTKNAKINTKGEASKESIVKMEVEAKPVIGNEANPNDYNDDTDHDSKEKNKEINPKKSVQRKEIKVTQGKETKKTIQRRTVISKGSVFACSQCNLEYKTKCSLTRHIKYTHQTRVPKHLRVKCYKCTRMFDSEEKMLNHWHIHTRPSIYKCDTCQKEFLRRICAEAHQKYHMGTKKKFTCELCGHSFNDKCNFNKHVKTVHEKIREFHCSICNNSFSTKKYLKEHTYKHTGERPFLCNICSKGFTNTYNLNQHIKKHEDQAKKLKELATNGVKIETPEETLRKAIRLLTCKTCQITFDNRREYLKHVRDHENGLQCHLCKKKYISKYALKAHIGHHYGERKHVCKECSARFCHRSQLDNHFRKLHDPTYVKPAPVKCTKCNYKVNDLQKHLKLHDRVKIKCPMCDKTYVTKNTLNRHIRVHHYLIKPHSCDVCGMGFVKKNVFEKHLRKCHELEVRVENDESATKSTSTKKRVK